MYKFYVTSMKFKNTLIGPRLVLKKAKATLKLAKVMFKVVDENRLHLRPWLPWEKLEKKVEDALIYLVEKEKTNKKGEEIDYGIFINKEYAGNISAFKINKVKKSAEIGYWISSKFSGKGYVTEAVSILEKELFENLKLNRVVIQCDEENLASAKVAQKCHYTLEGKLREKDYSPHFKNFRTHLIFSKLKSEYQKDQKSS